MWGHSTRDHHARHHLSHHSLQVDGITGRTLPMVHRIPGQYDNQLDLAQSLLLHPCGCGRRVRTGLKSTQIDEFQAVDHAVPGICNVHAYLYIHTCCVGSSISPPLPPLPPVPPTFEPPLPPVLVVYLEPAYGTPGSLPVRTTMLVRRPGAGITGERTSGRAALLLRANEGLLVDS